jgi:plasmid stabilization system protein ParE
MAKTIIITQRAVRKMSEIADYLAYEFSKTTADKFIQLAYSTYEKIAEHPTKGRKKDESSTLQYVNMDKHRQIFYRTYGNAISIVDIFDTRQDPNKSPK